MSSTLASSWLTTLTRADVDSGIPLAEACRDEYKLSGRLLPEPPGQPAIYLCRVGVVFCAEQRTQLGLFITDDKGVDGDGDPKVIYFSHRNDTSRGGAFWSSQCHHSSSAVSLNPAWPAAWRKSEM